MKCPQNLYWNQSIHYEIFCEMTRGDTLRCKFSNNISLAEQFYVYVIINRWHFHDNGSSYEKDFSICLFNLPMKISLPSISQLFPSSVASLPSHQLCSVTPLPSHTVHLTSSFLNSSWWLITMNSYQSNTPIQNKKANFQTKCPSVHLHHSVCTIFIPFTASSSSILHSKACPMLQHKPHLHHCILVLPRQHLMSCVDKMKFTQS